MNHPTNPKTSPMRKLMRASLVAHAPAVEERNAPSVRTVRECCGRRLAVAIMRRIGSAASWR